MHIVDLIAAKRDGHAVGGNDSRQLILRYTANDIPDYQMAAFLMAGYRSPRVQLRGNSCPD